MSPAFERGPDLAPFCARIQVAGSVRRRKEVVGDIKMVAIPRYAPAGLFGACTANLLWAHLHASETYRFTKGDHANGRYYQLALPTHAGVQLDLFLAQPDTWGLTVLVRTGSAAFSTALRARPVSPATAGAWLDMRQAAHSPCPDIAETP